MKQGLHLKHLRLLLRFIICAIIIASSPVEAATHVVQVTDGQFIPAHIQILQGDTVQWQWSGSNTMGHDVRAGFIGDRAVAPYQGAFTSQLRTTGYTFSHTFSSGFLSTNPSNNNVYQYFCEPHQFTGMVGSVSILSSDRAHSANLTGWQTGTNSGATGSCELTVASNSSQVTVTCSHNVASATTAAIYHSGSLGASGSELCSFSAASITNQSCATNASIINSLLAGQMYIVVRSSSSPNGEIRGQFSVKNGSARVAGVARDQNGARLEGVTVQGGGVSAATNVFGNYALDYVPNGVYQLTATVSGGSVTANSGTNPVFVNNIDLDSRDFTATVNGGGGGGGGGGGNSDSDGDGVLDSQEAIDGSNLLDRGSYKDHLSSPLYVLWNGFLRMTNILEILNTGDQALGVTVKIYNISGQLVSSTPLSVVARGQFDLILNDVAGFQADSFGIAALEFASDRADDIEGRMFFYRPDLAFGGYEFAFGVPFVTPLRGVTSVGFNTYQPSINSGESSYLVYQWLALVNLDSQNAQSFSINTYDMLGTLLVSRQVSVPPFGRVDLSGGHEDPGPSNVGQHVIIPQGNGPYMAQLFRYGSDALPGLAPRRYYFAFPLLARAGNGEIQSAPISVVDGSENWLELANTLNQAITVNVRFYGRSGVLKSEQNLGLPAYGQQHVYAAGLLSAGETGMALIAPSAAGSVVGQSMFYFRDSAGTVEAMYGSSIRETFGKNTFGSYNRYLGMANRLKLSNLTSGTLTTTVKVFDQAGLLKKVDVLLNAFASTELPIHSAVQFNTRPDTFGVIEVETDSPEQVFSELLRLRPIATGGVDFAAPTLIR